MDSNHRGDYRFLRDLAASQLSRGEICNVFAGEIREPFCGFYEHQAPLFPILPANCRCGIFFLLEEIGSLK